MTGRVSGRRGHASDHPARSRRLGAALAAIPRQARADAWPLLVTVAVLAAIVAAADAGPRLLAAAADDTVRAAVAADGTDLTVTAPFRDDFRMTGQPPVDTVNHVKTSAQAIAQGLPPELAPLFSPPVATVGTIRMPLTVPDGRNEASLRLTYVWDGEDPAIEWLEGGPPIAVHPTEPWSDDVAWPVQVGVSTETAAVLRVGPSDRIDVVDPTGLALDITVSGVFRPADPLDQVWRWVPDLLTPQTRGSGLTARTEIAAYLSAESLPAARLTLDPADTVTTYRLAVRSSELNYRDLASVIAQISALESDPPSIGLAGTGFRVTSSLDGTLLAVQSRVAAASSQAAVLLVGLVATGALVLVLAADVVARRRSGVLARHRARGASLAGIAAPLLVEALVLATAGGVLGLVLAAVVVPGEPSWPWPAPVLAVVVLAWPVLGARAARTGDTRRPTDRRRRRAAARVGTVRRATLEASVMLLAAGSLAALLQRGVPAGTTASADLLLSAAPTLVALAGAVLAYRALPAALGGLLAAGRRSRRAGPMLAAARARAAGAVALPFVVLVLATTLLGMSAVLTQSIRSGQVTGSWDTVGADVRIQAEPGTDPAALLALESADGVTVATSGRTQEPVQIFGSRDADYVRVVAVEPAEFQRLLAATPLEDAPQLAQLGDALAPGSPVPALVGPGLVDGGELTLLWQDQAISIAAVGRAPALGSAITTTGSDPVRQSVVVSIQTLAEAAGNPIETNAVWVVGPGADAAARVPAWADATVTSRADWLTARTTEPLTSGLLLLVAGSIVVLLALAMITVVLSASAGAPERAATLAAFRVLGVGRRGAASVALGELAPPVLAASVTGLTLGVLLAAVMVAPLGLRLVTGQASDPALVLSWWGPAALGVLAGTVVLLVAVESSARRRERLGQVLRVGNS